MENDENEFEDFNDIEIDDIKETDWKAEAQKYKAIATRLKKKVEQPKEQPVEKVPLPKEVDVQKVLAEQDERVELRMQGYTHPEIEFMSRNRKEGQSLTEASGDTFVKAGIETVRAKAQSEQQTPNPSNRAIRFNGKSFGEIISEGSDQEKQNAFEQLVSKRMSNQSE